VPHFYIYPQRGNVDSVLWIRCGRKPTATKKAKPEFDPFNQSTNLTNQYFGGVKNTIVTPPSLKSSDAITPSNLPLSSLSMLYHLAT